MKHTEISTQNSVRRSREFDPERAGLINMCCLAIVSPFEVSTALGRWQVDDYEWKANEHCLGVRFADEVSLRLPDLNLKRA